MTGFRLGTICHVSTLRFVTGGHCYSVGKLTFSRLTSLPGVTLGLQLSVPACPLLKPVRVTPFEPLPWGLLAASAACRIGFHAAVVTVTPAQELVRQLEP